MSADFSDIDASDFRKLVFTSPTIDREFRCAECGARCTRLLDGVSEAGHIITARVGWNGRERTVGHQS